MISYKNQKTMSNKVDSIVEGNKLIAFFMGAAMQGEFFKSSIANKAYKIQKV
jgi:hypothetical protein